MPIVQFEGLPKKRFAVAMEWRGLQGAGGAARREAAAIAKESQVTFGAILEDEETGIAAVGLTNESGFGVISAAAWLAKSCQKEGLILVERTIDGMYWVCSVRGKMPMAEGDMLVPFEEVSARVSACKMRSPDARICSNVEGIEDLLGPNVVGQSFAEIVSSADEAPVRLRRLIGGERRLIVFATAAAVVVAGYVFVDDYLKKAKAAKNQAVLAAATKAAKDNDERMVEQLKAQRLAEALRKMGEVVLDRPSVSDSVSATTNAIRALPISRGGWTPVKVDCGFGYCTVSWKRSTVATASDFLHAAQVDSLQVTSIKDDIASTYLEIQAQPRQSSADSLSPTGPFMVVLQTNLQRLGLAGLSSSIKGPDSIDKLIPKPPAQKNVKSVTFDPLPWSVGEFTVRGKNTYEIAGLPDYLHHQGIAMKSAAVNLDSGQWEMTFSFLAK